MEDSASTYHIRKKRKSENHENIEMQFELNDIVENIFETNRTDEDFEDENSDAESIETNRTDEDFEDEIVEIDDEIDENNDETFEF